MGRHDIIGDAHRVYDVVAAGGAAILPSDIGYCITNFIPD